MKSKSNTAVAYAIIDIGRLAFGFRCLRVEHILLHPGSEKSGCGKNERILCNRPFSWCGVLIPDIPGNAGNYFFYCACHNVNRNIFLRYRYDNITAYP